MIHHRTTTRPILERHRRHFVNVAASLLFVFLFSGLSASHLSGQARTKIGAWDVSGPYHHGNLTLFLFHGSSNNNIKMMTLEEGMKQGLVKVYETGTVNTLAVENLSPDSKVYIQAGDIVKGGRQDRTLGVDLVLAPASGKIPIASFCVERGRWSQRGDESDEEFSGCSEMVASNSLRLAVKESKNQSEVWSQVSVVQSKISKNLGLSSATAAETQEVSENLLNVRVPANLQNANVILFTPENSVSENVEYVQQGERSEIDEPQQQLAVQVEGFNEESGLSVISPTSLQLSLENEKLLATVEEYIQALQKSIDGQDDVVGFAFMINGRMVNADIYSSSSLFRSLWPRLLRAAAVEAVSEGTDETGELIGGIDQVRTSLLQAEAAPAEEESVSENIRTIVRKNKEHVMFETIDDREEGSWLHRNYMKVEEVGFE